MQKRCTTKATHSQVSFCSTKALTCYDMAIGLKPTLADAHVNRGNALRNLRRLNEAIAAYDRALDVEPALASAHWDKAHCLLLMGDWNPLSTLRMAQAA